jgi:hypothetical protein
LLIILSFLIYLKQSRRKEMYEDDQDFIKLINSSVACWTKKYIFYTKVISKTPDIHKYSRVTKDI